MLSRLWHFFAGAPAGELGRAVPKQSSIHAPEPAAHVRRDVSAPPPLGARATNGSLGPAGATDGGAEARESFFAQLTREHAPVAPVESDDEPRIVELVLQIVAYVTQKKLDPPVMPVLVPRVLAIVGEPEVDLVRLTHVIQQDLAISAKLLSVANSPLFGSQVEVKTVRHAIAHLGTEQVAQVAIGLACRSSLDSSSGSASAFASRWQRLFHHGMTCAFVTAQLAGKQERSALDAAFLGGLFHDVGKAVALRALEALAKADKLSPTSDAIIDEALHRVHAFPGDEFYEKWTLPSALMELCTSHHQLDELANSDRTLPLVSLISAFDALLSGCASERRDALSEAQTSAAMLGFSDDQLHHAYTETRARSDRTREMFGL